MVNSLADVLTRGFVGRQWTFAKGCDDLVFTDGAPAVTLAEIEAMDAQLVASDAAMQYSKDRAAAYPSFADQFDLLYHVGLDGWKAAIQAVKDKYPKPIV